MYSLGTHRVGEEALSINSFSHGNQSEGQPRQQSKI